jgi:hypothetical protein
VVETDLDAGAVVVEEELLLDELDAAVAVDDCRRARARGAARG